MLIKLKGVTPARKINSTRKNQDRQLLLKAKVTNPTATQFFGWD